MQSPWEVTSLVIGGRRVYAVYRLRDPGATDHSGNREYAGGYLEDKEKAEARAAELNRATAMNHREDGADENR